MTSIPTVRSTVPWTKLPDGAVLFSPDSEVYYAMNGVAAVIWELMSQNKYSFDELCAALSERFPDATSDQIRGDIIEFLDDLASSDLVESTRSEPAA
jgi:coenzyme PQQ synthesis protein D (PqqD)